MEGEILRNINDVFESIAKSILDAMPDKWSHSTLDVEYHGDSAKFDATFETPTGKVEDFDVEYQVFKDFDELYTIMTSETDKHKWNRAKFKLTPDNKFNIDFDWDQKLSDEIEQFNS